MYEESTNTCTATVTRRADLNGKLLIEGLSPVVENFTPEECCDDGIENSGGTNLDACTQTWSYDSNNGRCTAVYESSISGTTITDIGRT